MEKGTFEIEGTNVQDEARKYTFILMDSETGTELFHKYAPMVVSIYKELQGLISKLKSGTLEEVLYSTENIMMVMEEVPKMIPWELVKGWAGFMLAGHKMECEEGTFTAGENGFSDYTGDPLEMYVALMYAMMANYPKYVGPFLASLTVSLEPDSQTGSTPGSSTGTPQTDS